MERILTGLSLSASGFFATYSVRITPDIESEMSWRGSVVTPRRGTMFGCVKYFHITATWWKVCGFRQYPRRRRVRSRGHTFVTFRGTFLGYTPARLIRTFEPLRVPSHTYTEAGVGLTSNREAETVQDFGRTSLMQQILLSSRMDSWNARPAGSGISTIT